MDIKLRHYVSFFLLLVVISFQNCGKVEFANSLSNEGRLCALSSCREGEIVPEQDIYKPALKVVLVVDNSYSMSQAQEKLAFGVQSLIDGLKGFESSYYVYSTTQTGDKNAMTTKSGCRKEKDGVTTDLASCPTTKELGAVYTSYQRNELTSSLSSGPDFQIAADAGEDAFIDLKARLGAVITGVGTAGDDSERGICTLLRTVYEDGANKIFNPGDVTVFGVISDEEDNSTVANCFSKKETRTDCTAEDTTPINKTRSVTCTNPECITYPVTYKVELGSRTTKVKKIVYQRRPNQTYTRVLKWSERPEQTYKESFTYRYLVPQPARDGVPQPPLEQNGTASRNITILCQNTGPCDSSQTSFINSQLATGNSLVTESCQVSCSANAAPVTSPKSKTLGSEANCNTWDENTCKSAAGVSNYVAGSCVTYSCTANSIAPENRTYSTTEVDSCTASTCTDSQISAINPGSGYQYVENSCQVTCEDKTYDAVTKTKVVDHKTPNTSDIAGQSYCNRTYSGEPNIGVYLSKQNNNRPVVSCAIDSIGAAKYDTYTENYTELPPAGTPKCVTTPQKTFGFPTSVETSAAPNLITSFGNRASELFGSNYFVSSIIHDSVNNEMCPIKPGQSIGNRYSEIVSLTPNQGLVSSICSADYGVALENASHWVKKSMKDIFVAPDVDATKEEIIDIWISRGNERVEIKDSVEVSGATVKFKSEGIVQPGDRIRYTILKK